MAPLRHRARVLVRARQSARPGGRRAQTLEFIRKVKRVNPRTEIIMYIYTPVPLAGELYDAGEGRGLPVPGDARGVDQPRLAGVLAAAQRAHAWLADPLRRQMRDFERVLNAYYPTSHRPELRRTPAPGAARRERLALPPRVLSLPVRAAAAAAPAGLPAAGDVRLLTLRRGALSATPSAGARGRQAVGARRAGAHPVRAGASRWWRGFDGLYGQDAVRLLRVRDRPLRDAPAPAALPLPPFFWPPGYPLLVALWPRPRSHPLPGSLSAWSWARAGAGLHRAAGARACPRRVHDPPLLAGAVAGLQRPIVAIEHRRHGRHDRSGAGDMRRRGRGPVLARPAAARAGCSWPPVSSAARVLARWIYALVALPFARTCSLHGPRTIHRGSRRARSSLRCCCPSSGRRSCSSSERPQRSASFAGNFQVYSWPPLNAVLARVRHARRPTQLRAGRTARTTRWRQPIPRCSGRCWRRWIVLGAVRGPRSAAVLLGGWAALVFAFTPARRGRTSASRWPTCRRWRS